MARMSSASCSSAPEGIELCAVPHHSRRDRTVLHHSRLGTLLKEWFFGMIFLL